MRRRLLQPRIIISVTLSIALLALLLAIGNVHRVLKEVAAFALGDIAWFVLFFLLYEAIRGIQWSMLLRALDRTLSWRGIALSFVTGEATKILPLGNYFPNYLLRETDQRDFGLTSAATSAIVFFEVTVSLLAIAVLGVGSWSTWLRPLVIVGSLAFLLVVAGVYRLRKRLVVPSRIRRHQQARKALAELHQFRVGVRRLARPRTILMGLLLCAAYLAAASAAFQMILRGLGVDSLSFTQVAGAYTFMLAFALIEPSPIDLGVLELGGVGALLALGVDTTTAVTAMLVLRVLSTVLSLMTATLGVTVLHRTFLTALRGTSPAPVGASEPSVP